LRLASLLIALLSIVAAPLAAPTATAKPRPPAATVKVTVDRSAPDATSRWVPAHTVVSNEFYFPWGLNQGPDTLAGTAQYAARTLELQGITQHNVHIMAWDRWSPWLSEADPVPDPDSPYVAAGGSCTHRWCGQGLDQEIKRAADAGLTPTITLAMAPGWMVGKRTAGNGIVTPIADWSPDFYAARVTTDKLPQWLALVDAIVRRYVRAPYNVRTFDIWNEFKGFYDPDANNYDSGLYPGTAGKADMGYTYFYNRTRAQILASAQAVGVTSGIRTGGPYVVGDLWDSSGAGGYPVTDGRGSANSTLAGANSYGWVDGRPLDAIKTWLAGKSGAEFISLRFGFATRQGTILGTDWDALRYAADLARWVRGLPEAQYPGASTLAFWNAEHYTPVKTDAAIEAKKAAFSAESYRIGIRSGFEAMLRWGSRGLDGLTLWTTTPVSNNQELRSGDGLAGNGQAVQRLFKQAFSSGTPLYRETISDPAKLSALANATHTLLINKTNANLGLTVNGAAVTLAPYEVRLSAL
jgi:hypothetical protein